MTLNLTTSSKNKKKNSPFKKKNIFSEKKGGPSMRNCMKKFETHLLSRKRFLWVDTYEEQAFIKDLKALISSNVKLSTYQIQFWSPRMGLAQIPLDNTTEITFNREFAGDKIYARIIESQKANNDMNIWLMADLQLVNGNPMMLRGLRDALEGKYNSHNPIVALSPIVDIKPEWEKLATVFHYELPDKPEIRGAVNAIVSRIEESASKSAASAKAGIDGAPTSRRKEYVVPGPETVNSIVDALAGLTINEILEVLRESVISHNTICLDTVMEKKRHLIEKSGVLLFVDSDISFSDIGGNELFKSWFRDEISPSFTPGAKEFGCSVPKGYVALGPPGCSKTMGAMAVAKELGVPLIKLDLSMIMNKFVGDSEKRIAQAFRTAKACSPCVLFIDEVEKMLGGIRSSNSSDAGTTARVFGTILGNMDEDNGIFVVMTSNDVSQLPPELTRAGRLDAIFYFGLPSTQEREEIFKIHVSKVGREISDADLDVLVSMTSNYSGAEIQQIVKGGMRKAFSRFQIDGNRDLLLDDLSHTVSEVIPIYRSSSERIAALEAWAKNRVRYSSATRSTNELNSSLNNDLDNDLMMMDLSDI